MVDNRRLNILLKDCAKGFYQQMYFWGKDVTHSQGNQLRAYGFKKSPSKGLPGTSCYTYTCEDSMIELYGSCAAFYSEHTNIVFLRQRGRFYQWISPEKLIAGRWKQEDLKSIKPSAMLQAMTPFLEWWIDYEQWIQEQHGNHYREQCHQEWKKVNSRLSWLKPTVAMQWVKTLILEKDKHVRPKHFA